MSELHKNSQIVRKTDYISCCVKYSEIYQKIGRTNLIIASYNSPIVGKDCLLCIVAQQACTGSYSTVLSISSIVGKLVL